METLNILMLGSEFTSIPAAFGGGTEKVVLELASGLAKAGHRVKLMAVRDETTVESEKLKGVELLYVRIPKKTGSLKRIPVFDYNVGKHLMRTDVDIIHSHTRYAAATVNAFSNLANVFHQHNWDTWQEPPYGLKRRIFYEAAKKVEIYAIKKATLTLCVSEELKKTLRRNLPQVKNKLMVFANAVDPEDYLTIKDDSIFDKYNNLDKAKMHVLQVGRLSPEKGVDVLLKAAAIAQNCTPEVEFVIVGPTSSFVESKQKSSPYLELLESMMKNLQLHNVRLLGKVPLEDLRKLYSIADICVSSSYVEGMPLSVLEAMASAKPVIATDIGGTNEIVTDKVNGLLFQPGNHEELAEIILTLISDAAKRKDLGRKARATIEKKFSWDTRIDELVRIYKGILSSGVVG